MSALTPEEIDFARKVFEEIANENWFTQDPEQRELFAVYVMLRILVIKEAATLAEDCRAEARRHYSH